MFITAALHVKHCSSSDMFRPIVSLPDSPCPMLIASREPEIQLTINRSSPSPAQQTYSAWNQRISERFFLILGYILSTGLSYRLTLISCR